MTDDELNEWGIDFASELDEAFKDDPGYVNGNSEYIMQAIEERYPNLDDDQLEWLEEWFEDA
jgi:hypothetical protein